MHDIENSADVIDSRDLIARIEEMEGERGTLVDEITDTENDMDESDPENVADSHAYINIKRAEIAKWDAENAEELRILKAVASQGEDFGGDWDSGATMIRDSYFEEYMDEMLEDIGVLQPYADRPSYIKIEIDYDALQMDYSSIDYDGVTYWIR